MSHEEGGVKAASGCSAGALGGAQESPGAAGVGAALGSGVEVGALGAELLGSDAARCAGVCSKLRLLKRPLSKLNREAFAHNDKQEIQLRDRLHYV
ncbi:hypothetical protein RIF29_24644 [Crotalaria pallida]|uniref:Uncharacterized protein n=1 Tax=Crotalaria pallida TaxID=3830 RepID=A0AAN9EQB0_CROPI